MCASAIAPVDDDVLVVLEDELGARSPAPFIERIADTGDVGWRTSLAYDLKPIDYLVKLVAYQQDPESREEPDWQYEDDEEPRSWSCLSRRLTVSGDAVLVCFEDIMTGMGYGTVLSTADGGTRYRTSLGPLSQTAALGNGEFLVGYRGYDRFFTDRYGRTAERLDRWESHGLYVVEESGIRVIELPNGSFDPTHLARLPADKPVDRGARLDGYHTSEPHGGADGRLYFVRERELLAARDLSIEDRLPLTLPENSEPTGRLVGIGNRLYCAFHDAGRDGSSTLACVEV